MTDGSRPQIWIGFTEEHPTAKVVSITFKRRLRPLIAPGGD